MADDPIVFRYESKKGLSFPGIPAESLTQAQYDALSPSLKREVLHSGGWTKLTPNNSEEKTEGDDLTNMTRAELNSYAGRAGVVDPEDYANKAELIAAIEAAQQGQEGES